MCIIFYTRILDVSKINSVGVLDEKKQLYHTERLRFRCSYNRDRLIKSTRVLQSARPMGCDIYCNFLSENTRSTGMDIQNREFYPSDLHAARLQPALLYIPQLNHDTPIYV